MSKHKLDDGEESVDQVNKLVKLDLSDEAELKCDASNGDRINTEFFVEEKLSKVDETENLGQDLLNNDTSPSSESQILSSIAPAKRISKRSVKKSVKLKKEKCDGNGVVQPGSELLQDNTEEETGCKGKRRTWERWSKEDTYIFFEGLSEYGKDFDKLQAHFKAKYRNRKDLPESYIKNKDQIRHFYYRTWHKISGHINFSKDVKNNTKELKGLINYGELWKKLEAVSGAKLDDVVQKSGKLDDMVKKGFAMIKIKGKAIRIKTPVARALKKLNVNSKEVNSHKSKTKSKLPSKVSLYLKPRTTSDWCRVHKTAQNPHVKISLGVDRKLSSVIKCLERKWRTADEKTKENLGLKNNIESHENGELNTVEQFLVLLPPRGVTIRDSQNCFKATNEEKMKRPKIKLKLTGFDSCSSNSSQDKPCCDNNDAVETDENKFEEILSSQRKRSDDVIENGIDDNSNDTTEAEDINVSPKQEGESPRHDELTDNVDDEYNEYVLEDSDHECSRSPTHNDDTLENNDDIIKEDDGSETEIKDEEDDIKDEGLDEEDGLKLEKEDEVSDSKTVFNAEDGWTLDTVGQLTLGELFLMISDCNVARINLEYTWRHVKTEDSAPVMDMLTRFVRLASCVGRGAGSVGRGRSNSTSSGGGSPSVRSVSSPVTRVQSGGAMSPVGRGLGVSGAAKQIIMPGGPGAPDVPGSPLAVPLDPAEHEFRKPLLPVAPVPVRQVGAGAAFKEQIGQYLPKWSNRAQTRQRRTRPKQVVGRQLLQPRPGVNTVQIVNNYVSAPSSSSSSSSVNISQIQVVSLPVVDVADIDTNTITVLPDSTVTISNDAPVEETDEKESKTSTDRSSSPPQISIPSPSRQTPSPPPSFSSFMDMSFESMGQRTPTKNDQFLAMYNDGDNSLLQTPPRPAPSPSPGFNPDISLSSWSINFESPLKNLSLPLPFNEDSQSSTISTVSEVSKVILNVFN